uniref:uncharacterized protein LOC118154620 isoform X3 n=1 Tax=Callithrix jacchus TaxID=9483 RepID=UPI00159D3746|nr:uncharacterized protein LOC118154620 isoform X3 [Callithrix jacchus]
MPTITPESPRSRGPSRSIATEHGGCASAAVSFQERQRQRQRQQQQQQRRSRERRGQKPFPASTRRSRNSGSAEGQAVNLGELSTSLQTE